MQKDWGLDWMQVLQQMKKRSRHHTLAYLAKQPWFLADFFSLHAVIVSSGDESIRSFFLEWTDSITRVFSPGWGSLPPGRQYPSAILQPAHAAAVCLLKVRSELHRWSWKSRVWPGMWSVLWTSRTGAWSVSLTSRNRKPVRSASCQRGTSWAQFSSPTLKTAGEVDDLLTSIDILNHFHTFFQMILNIFTCWHFQVFIGIFTCFLHVFNPWTSIGGDLPSLQDLSEAAEAAAGGCHSPELRPSPRGPEILRGAEVFAGGFFGCFLGMFFLGMLNPLWDNTIEYDSRIQYGYGSIPIKIAFVRGMNIHVNQAILMWTEGGTIGFDTLPCWGDVGWWKWWKSTRKVCPKKIGIITIIWSLGLCLRASEKRLKTTQRWWSFMDFPWIAHGFSMDHGRFSTLSQRPTSGAPRPRSSWSASTNGPRRSQETGSACARPPRPCATTGTWWWLAWMPVKGKPSNLPGRTGGWGWDMYIYIYIYICYMYIYIYIICIFLFGLELRGYSMSIYIYIYIYMVLYVRQNIQWWICL